MFNMIVQPPCYWLNVGIPRIFGTVAVAIITCNGKGILNFLVHGVTCGYVVFVFAGKVLFRSEELNDDEYDCYGGKDFGFHAAKYFGKERNIRGI